MTSEVKQYYSHTVFLPKARFDVLEDLCYNHLV